MMWNEGAIEAVRQMHSAGLIGVVRKVWVTNRDPRVCPICEPLEGEERELDEDFSGGFDTAPAHVGCRCGVAYRRDR